METSYHKLQYLLCHESDWNNWLAYLLISSGSWQPLGPGDLAYSQRVQRGGNYRVTLRPGCCTIPDPRLYLCTCLHLFVKWEKKTKKTFFLCLICHFILSFCPWLLEFTVSSFSKVICLSILKSDLCCTWKVKCGRWNWCLVGRRNAVIYGTVKCIMCNSQN